VGVVKKINKKSHYFKKIKLENEIIIFEIVFGMVHGRPYNEFQKVPIYQFRLLITKINPSCGWLPM